jgi:hypothetical protein
MTAIPDNPQRVGPGLNPGTVPLTRTRGSQPGSDGTRNSVYTASLTGLILASLIALGLPGTSPTGHVLALIIGAASAGVLLGRGVWTVQGIERVGAQGLPHEHDQRH